MKRIISLFVILNIVLVAIFSGNSYAAETLNSVNVDVDKTLVRPGEEVKVTVDFGTDMGKYTVNVAYDNKIFEFVRAEGGNATNETTNIKVDFEDSTNGSQPSSATSVIFKAKAELTTSNQTEFQITTADLKGSGGTVEYENISPTNKLITVEPQYVDYTINLTTEGNIIKGELKPMVLSYSSPIGRYYEEVALIAEATTPDGASVKLLGTDMQGTEHDIIASGWGDTQGTKIGGLNVSQILNVRGLFSDAGAYTITIKLIDRKNLDKEITTGTFSFTVLDEEPEETTPQTTEELPETLPKTGSNIYIPIIIVLIAIVSSYIYFNRKNSKNNK